MTWDQRVRRLAELHEGRRRYAYRDTVGKITIGIGRNLDDVGLSDDEIDYLYANDHRRVRADLDRALPWWRWEDGVRRAALADLCFNLGIVKLLRFRATLRHWRAGEYDAAARQLQHSLWYRQVKTRGVRIVRMVRTGEWPPEIA